jgi:TnpA family transposase
VYEGLNAVESWNAANGFIFNGRGGELTTNRSGGHLKGNRFR